MLRRILVLVLVCAAHVLAPSNSQAQPSQAQAEGQTGMNVQPPHGPIDSLFEAWRVLDTRLYIAQWAPDAVKIDRRSGARQDTAALLADRARLFAQLAAVDVTYAPTVVGSTEFDAKVHVAYTMRFRFKSGRVVSEGACETYLLQNRGGTWLIVENVDYESCDTAPGRSTNGRPLEFGAMSCDELWHARNSIYAQYGFCFKQPRSIAIFGKACFPPYGQLPAAAQVQVNQIAATEQKRRCPK